MKVFAGLQVLLFSVLTAGAQGSNLNAAHRTPVQVLYEATAIAYPYDMSATVQLIPTGRTPHAHGKVHIEREKGATRLKVELDDIKPARLFGGDYNTYVLWALSPDGMVQNLGELVLEGDHSELQASTSFEAFAILITAEPHYLVTAPSPFLILKNASDVEGINGSAKTFVVHYKAYPGRYAYERETLEDLRETDVRVRTLANQAWTAVYLARRAHADQYAPSEYRAAEQALERMLNVAAINDRPQTEAEARNTIRLAVAAEQHAHDAQAARKSGDRP